MPHLTHRTLRHTVTACAGVLLVLAVAMPAGAEPAIYGPHYLPPDVGGNADGLTPYTDLWCADGADCVFVGPGTSPGTSLQATVLTEASGAVGAPLPIDPPGDAAPPSEGGTTSLNSVSCWSIGNCVAVGAYGVTVGSGANQQVVPVPMAVDEVGGIWQSTQKVSLPTSANVELGWLTDASCDGAGDCTAVGFCVEEDPSAGLIVPHLIVVTQPAGSTTWSSPSALPDVPGSNFIEETTALSCTGATTCEAAAIGIDETTISETGAFLSESAGTWTSTDVGSVHGQPASIAALTCVSDGDCVAVGAVGGGVPAPVVDTETAGTWSAPRALPLPFLGPPTIAASLDSISCLSLTECVATGTAETSSNYRIEIGYEASNVGTGWTGNLDNATVLANGTPAAAEELGPVQCLNSHACRVLGAAGLVGAVGLTDVTAYWSTVTPSQSLHPAGKPAHVEVRSTSASTKVTFEPPASDGGAPITYFSVTARSKGEPTRTCVTAGLSCSFRGAVAGKTYAITVFAHTKAGVSLPSPARVFVAK